MSRSRYRARLLRQLTWLVPSAVAIAACNRPDYTYSDDVPVKGAGASSNFSGSTSLAGSFSAGGTAAIDPCALDRSVAASPIFIKQALSNQLPVRPELYAQLTNAEVAALRQGGSLIPPPSVPPVASTLNSVLNATWGASADLSRPLLVQLLNRFKETRTLWPNPWALRLLDHPGSERMNAVRVVLKKDAWVVRIFEGGPPTVVDVNNGMVPIDQATAQPERIAAIYYVYDDRVPGNSLAACEQGKRELALGNEAMVEEFSTGTPEILARLNSDIDALTAFFDVVRPCASVERGSGTFHAFTVCQTWHFFDPSSEYSAYQWALSNPMELYKPKTQNLATLIDALKDDRFEPAPFVGTPLAAPSMGGTGGTTGAAGAENLPVAGDAQGGSPDGGSSL